MNNQKNAANRNTMIKMNKRNSDIVFVLLKERKSILDHIQFRPDLDIQHTN